jgi:hypothetical protein
MDTVLSLLISAGIIAFGVWVVAGTITAGWPWTLMGLLAVIVGLLSLYESVQEAKTRRFYLCVPKIRFGVDAAGGRRKLAS